MSDETNTQSEGGQSEPRPGSGGLLSQRRPIDPPSDPLAAIGTFFRENPAVAGSVLYLQITIIGIIYAWSLYRIYDINIFDFAETNDFLLAAFKDPYTFIMSVGALLAFVGLPMWFLHRREKQFYKVYRKVYGEEADSDQPRVDKFAEQLAESYLELGERYLAISRKWFLLFISLGLLYTLLIPFLLANLTPKEQPVQLQYRGALTLEGQSCTTILEQGSTTAEGQDSTTSGRQSPPQQTVYIKTALIGSTENFTFFYDAAKKCSLIVPRTQIVHIETYSEGMPILFGRS
jgi:hypothetical protein